MWSRVSLIVCLFFLTASPALAAVTISEIAWMGNTASANDEWIELYNDGGAIDVSGWQLTDGMNLTIELTGTIPATSYAVLERTDDASAPGAAFLIYTGALTNTGATLSLRRADGSVADQVAGGDDWENVGGDNTTKETAQLTSRGWGTAAATPGQPNQRSEAESSDERDDIERDDDVSEESSSAVVSVRSDRSVGSASTINLEPRTLSLAIDAQREVYVNQPVTFEAVSSGLGKVLLQSLRYDWNFGDLHTAYGATTSHRFAYPGQYLVSLHGQYKFYDAVAVREITVLPQQLSINQLPNGDVQLHNDAMTTIDVSGYEVAGVPLPQRTSLLPRGTLTIPVAMITRRLGEPLLVRDTKRVVVASEAVPEMTARPALASETTLRPVPALAVASDPPVGFSFAEAASQPATPTISAVAASTTTAPNAQPLVAAAITAGKLEPATPSFPIQQGWLYIFIALLFGLVLGIYTRYL